MEGNSPIPTPKRHPPVDVDIGRTPERAPARRAMRHVRPEPHQRYELLDHEIPHGMDAQWVATSILGESNQRQIREMLENGWEPALASDFPRISGYDRELPQSLVDRGLLTPVNATDAVIMDETQMLMLRPIEMSQQAHKEREAAARQQMGDQYERLHQFYRPVGQRRGVETHRAPMPDTGE